LGSSLGCGLREEKKEVKNERARERRDIIIGEREGK
jgi:hypothetical protein